MKKLLIIPAFLVATTGVAFAGGYGHSSGTSIEVSHNKVIIKDSFNTATANGNTTTVTANTKTFGGEQNGATVYVNTVTQQIY
ncbi:MAG: hypothetical protein WA733_14750 [Methylocystis sp.]